MYQFNKVINLNINTMKININDQFLPLGKVSTIAATPSTVSLDKIKKNIAKYKYPRFHELKEFKKLNKEKIALVGGGPSIENTLKELREFKNIVACGSSHNYLVNNNIIPTYATICDPDPISANYYTNPQKGCNYLIATACDEKVFNILNGYQITMWHCYSDDTLKELVKIEPNVQAIGGGCTVGLRSLSIALMLGYSDIHFFGFDSCLGVNDKHHAYDFTDEQEQLGEIYKVKFGMYNGIEEKEYRCAGYQLAQADNFHNFYKEFSNMFVPTFHGEGLLPDYMRVIMKEDQRIKKLAA